MECNKKTTKNRAEKTKKNILKGRNMTMKCNVDADGGWCSGGGSWRRRRQMRR